ncbi:MAG: hypothetical protein AAFQ82_02245, partial [Myxococcota bacterium]
VHRSSDVLGAQLFAGQVALSEARQKIERLNAIPHPSEATELGASIRVMHGNEQIASSSTGYGSLGEDFARWIDTLESAA